MNTKVLFVSETGNTAQVAREIFRGIPSRSKDIQPLESAIDDYSFDCYFVGFWTNCGSANVEVLDFLSGLHGKKLALFSTCGMRNDSAYFSQIEHRVLAFLPDDNEYYGSFFCQGKMPMRVRQKYEQMLSGDHRNAAAKLIQNFDNALLHPSSEDLVHAADFAKHIYQKIEQHQEALK